MDLSRIAILYASGMELSAWVKLARTKRGWTQDQMADALGVTKGNVSAWENGRHEPGWAKLLTIGRLTCTPLPIPAELQMSVPKAGAELLADFNLLSAEDQALMAAQIKRLADLTSVKLNSAGAENNGTMEHPPQMEGARHQTARDQGVTKAGEKLLDFDEAVEAAKRLAGVEGASRSADKKGKKSNQSG